MASAHQVFEERSKKRGAEGERRERRMARLKDGIAGITGKAGNP